MGEAGGGHYYPDSPGDELWVLYCCLCLHAREGIASRADTVINGQAVCYDHMGYVQGGAFSAALAVVKKAEGQNDAT